MKRETRPVEVAVLLANHTWEVRTVHIPADTVDREIRDIAEELALDLEYDDECAGAMLYHVPDQED